MLDYKATERYKEGIKLMQEKYEQEVIDSVDSKLYEFCPELADLVASHGMVEIWKEKTSSFSTKEKELFVFSALVAQGGCNEEFEGHVYNALKMGNSKQQVKELLILLTLYVGVPKVLDKLPYVMKAFSKYDSSVENLKVK